MPIARHFFRDILSQSTTPAPHLSPVPLPGNGFTPKPLGGFLSLAFAALPHVIAHAAAVPPITMHHLCDAGVALGAAPCSHKGHVRTVGNCANLRGVLPLACVVCACMQAAIVVAVGVFLLLALCGGVSVCGTAINFGVEV